MASLSGVLEGETKETQNIPNPEDIGLDVIIDEIVDGARISGSTEWDEDIKEWGRYGKAVESDEVKQSGMDIARSMESKQDSIAQRQEIFHYMRENEKLRDLLLNEGVPEEEELDSRNREEWGSVFERRVNAVEQFTGFFEELKNQLSKEEAPESAQQYAQEIEEYTSSEDFQELEQILQDLESPTNTDIDIHLPMSKEKRYDDNWEISGKARIRSELESSRTGDSEGSRSYRSGDNWSDFLGTTFITDLISEVEEETGVNARLWKSPIDVEINVDEEDETVEAKASVERKSVKKWASNIIGGGEKEFIESELDISYEDLKWSGLDDKIREAKADAVSHEIKELYQGKYGGSGTLSQVSDSIAELKYVAAAAEYMNQLESKGVPVTMPEISDDGTTRLEGMLEPNLVAQEGHEDVVANDVDSTEDENVYVITGPNNGGKTTFMNAVGLAQAMYQLGMPVLAEDAEMTPNDSILTHYIQKGDIQRNESRYANELSRIEDVFEQATPESLILVDEPFSGTAPEEGAYQLEGTLRALEELGATTYASTHYHSVDVPEEEETIPELVEAREGSNNLHASTTDEESLEYTFRIEPGYSTVSEGRAVAEELERDPESLRGILRGREDLDFPLR